MDSLIDQAQALRKRGHKAQARDLLRSILDDDPDNRVALREMVYVAQDREEAVYYLDHLVALDPSDQWAQEMLNRAQKMVSGVPNGSQPHDDDQVIKPPQRIDATSRLDQRAAADDSGGPSGRIAAWWSQVRADWRIFRGNRLAMVGVVIIGVFFLMAIAHPILMETVWPRSIYHPEIGYDIDASPWPSPPDFPTHILGVDGAGRDVFSQLLASTRPSFTVAIAAAAATAAVSTIVGALGAYFRGPVDAVFANISDALLLLPVPIIMVLLGGRYYDVLSPLGFGLLYGLLAGASSAAIVMRSHAISIMNQPYIAAARVAGANSSHVITRHLIPHMLPLVAVHMMITVTGAVVAHGFVIFLGLSTGIRLNWGAMIYNAINAVSFRPDIQWISILVPTLCLSLFAAAFYFVGRGLQDVSDPRLRGDR